MFVVGLPLPLITVAIRPDVPASTVYLAVLPEPLVDLSGVPDADADAVFGLGALLELAHVDVFYPSAISADLLSDVLRVVGVVAVLAQSFVDLARLQEVAAPYIDIVDVKFGWSEDQFFDPGRGARAGFVP
eukprot:CAMPEP_0168334922 /NCGR_PEP_ID=MMETSP0213-20121227/10586_1 /TAXON_ID=151035 /ORGANISM="Euplotes harpa, Strain FSP1.4" /LENGTH=130 /DNA_ID=CAMNT_0008339719 /DNA_START=138 /DNA_END=530 /DNA_ORIENTATION=-